MSTFRGLLAAVVLLALPAVAAAWGDCQFTEPRSASVDASGATSARVIALAGSLTITGEEGSSRVEASGTACADSRSKLEKIELRAERSGQVVRVEVVIPGGWGDRGSLDLEIRVPKSLALDVEDGSGEVEVAGVGSLRLKDGSGGIEVRDVAQNLEIEDGSGEIEVRGVGGDLDIDDGSGEIDVRGVEGSIVVEDGSGSIGIEEVDGSVTIAEDGSGEIRITNVKHDVLVRRDGSGSIRVGHVGGNFTVERDGSGSIESSDVEGRVSVPSR